MHYTTLLYEFCGAFVKLKLNSFSPNIKKCFIEMNGQNIPECHFFLFYFVLFN